MTNVGTGGVVIHLWRASRRYEREYRKLPKNLRERVQHKLEDLLKDPRPSGLRFEKLQGYRNPSIYTIHVNGDYKVSLEINAQVAWLRRVNSHKKD